MIHVVVKRRAILVKRSEKRKKKKVHICSLEDWEKEWKLPQKGITRRCLNHFVEQQLLLDPPEMESKKILPLRDPSFKKVEIQDNFEATETKKYLSKATYILIYCVPHWQHLKELGTSLSTQVLWPKLGNNLLQSLEQEKRKG